jgi:DNA ligase-associated metallophosphoesterase
MLVNGVRLQADSSGALYWPERQVLAVADLHFEKGSAYAARGTLLPPYDTAATLAALADAVERLAPRIVICLGDSFHDQGARARIAEADADAIRALARGREWLWVIGNHDPDPPADLGGTVVQTIKLGRLTFRHAPRVDAGPGEVAGHLHPKAAVKVKGRRFVRRCFAASGHRVVLPAFGAYTGGLDVLDDAFAPLFAAGFEAHMLGRDRVHRFPGDRLVRI